MEDHILDKESKSYSEVFLNNWPTLNISFTLKNHGTGQPQDKRYHVGIIKHTHHMPQGILFLPKPPLQGKVISPPLSSTDLSTSGTVWSSKI